MIHFGPIMHHSAGNDNFAIYTHSFGHWILINIRLSRVMHFTISRLFVSFLLIQVRRYKCRLTPCGAVMANNKYAIEHRTVTAGYELQYK